MVGLCPGKIQSQGVILGSDWFCTNIRCTKLLFRLGLFCVLVPPCCMVFGSQWTQVGATRPSGKEFSNSEPAVLLAKVAFRRLYWLDPGESIRSKRKCSDLITVTN